MSVDLGRNVFVRDLYSKQPGSLINSSLIASAFSLHVYSTTWVAFDLWRLTKFMPSRVEVTKQASASAYIAVNSSTGTLLCR